MTPEEAKMTERFIDSMFEDDESDSRPATCSSSSPAKKPPLGVMPQSIWEYKRVEAISAAILRFKAEEKSVPEEWLYELKGLVR